MLKSADAAGSLWAWKRWGMGCSRAPVPGKGVRKVPVATLVPPGEVALRPDEWNGMVPAKENVRT